MPNLRRLILKISKIRRRRLCSHTIVIRLSKDCQKIVKRLSKDCHKIVKKLSKGNYSATLDFLNN